MTMDLRSRVMAGDRLASLEAIRDLLASTLTDSAPQYVAALSKQLADVLREIDQLNPPKVASTIDDLAARRTARRKKAAAPKRAAKRDVRGPRGG